MSTVKFAYYRKLREAFERSDVEALHLSIGSTFER
jgi:hypothetical protein